MSTKIVCSVFAALVTPRGSDGELDLQGFRRQVTFLMGRGIRGFVINGATGEYALNSTRELAAMARICREVLAGGGEFLCGIGSAGFRGCLENGRTAIEGGAQGLLLPAPHFFTYDQDDVEHFCRGVAEALPVPILLYNLPQFTHNGFEPATALRLIESVPNIVGIKDSSGSLEVLRALSAPGIESCRVVGNDGVLAQALRERVCDGVVSGVACAVPELLVRLFEAGRVPAGQGFIDAAARLDEFLVKLGGIPVPWGLKWVQECRGIVVPGFSQPVSDARATQGRALQAWFKAWEAEGRVSDSGTDVGIA